MVDDRGPSRRMFITTAAAAGGGLAVGLTVTADDAEAQQKRPPAGAAIAPPADAELNVWVVVKADETVVVRVVRSELGQGSLTGLAQLVAEELDCDWARVTTEQPLPGLSNAQERPWKDFQTTNSRSIRGSQEYVRYAGAAARWMLIEAAAEAWKVPSAELVVGNGIVKHPKSRRTITYGRIAQAAARLKAPDARPVKLGEPSAWSIVGEPRKRLDTADKLAGRAIYGIDVRLPGMLSAAVRQAPVFGAAIVSFDAAAVREMPGVRHVLRVDERTLAVVADSWWQAQKAVEKLPVVWSDPPEAKVSSASIAEQLREGLDQRVAFIGHTHGDALKAIAGAAKKVEAVYALPFLAHAPLEPPVCTARWSREKVEVWAPTQNAEGALRAVAEAAGLPLSAAELNRTAIGGSFGRRIRHDVIRQAVLIARRIPETPIKLIWSREEDMARSFYRPVSMFRLSGGIDDKGDLAGLIVRISGQSILGSQGQHAVPAGRDARMFQGLNAETGESQIGYSVPNIYIDHAMRNTHVPVGSWRSAHSSQNAFMLECFVDELARAADRDPVDFRRNLMKSHPRHLAVLTAASEKAGWSTPALEGRSRGVAQCMCYGSYTAAVAEVSVSAESKVTVHRIVLAIDCGQVVNPELVSAQVEGSVAFALSALFHQEITIRGGEVVERNFDSHGVIRLEEMPRVETVLVPSGDGWGGVGAAAVAVVAPAVVNAIYSATGKRVRSMPIRSGRLG